MKTLTEFSTLTLRKAADARAAAGGANAGAPAAELDDAMDASDSAAEGASSDDAAPPGGDAASGGEAAAWGGAAGASAGIAAGAEIAGVSRGIAATRRAGWAASRSVPRRTSPRTMTGRVAARCPARASAGSSPLRRATLAAEDRGEGVAPVAPVAPAA